MDATKTFGQESNLKKNTLREETARGTFGAPDILKIQNKDTRYAYRYINHAKFMSHGGIDVRGWEIVKGADKEASSASSGFGGEVVNSPDGTHRVGDLILARMPIEQAEARRAHYQKLSDTRMHAIHEKQNAARKGVHFDSEYKTERDGKIERA